MVLVVVAAAQEMDLEPVVVALAVVLVTWGNPHLVVLVTVVTGKVSGVCCFFKYIAKLLWFVSLSVEKPRRGKTDESKNSCADYFGK